MDIVQKTIGLLVLWQLLLTAMVIVPRAVLILGNGRPINSFKADGVGESDFMQRTIRAHSNMVETGALLFVPMLWAVAIDKGELLAPYVVWVFFARAIQSLIHISSTTPLAVYLRFAFFLPQLIFSAYAVAVLIGNT